MKVYVSNLFARVSLLVLTLSSLVNTSVCVKVFILAGQSNMVGYASGNHLRFLLDDAVSRPDYEAYAGRDGADFVVRDDVFVRFLDAQGNLTVGFGRDLELPTGNDDDYFGPELGFGVRMGEAMDEDVLLLKASWSSSALRTSWRPPSSGGTIGPLYNMTMDLVYDSLANISNYVGNYQMGGTVEIAGFVWFQGWLDVNRPRYFAEYEVNLRNFINDVRNDLQVPDMPFVIGEMGIRGDGAPERVFEMRRIQRSIADTVENVGLTETAQYGNEPTDGIRPDNDYHYFGRADHIIAIGEGFAESTLELMDMAGPEQSGVCVAEGGPCSHSRDCCDRRLFCNTSEMTCQRRSRGRTKRRKRRSRPRTTRKLRRNLRVGG